MDGSFEQQHSLMVLVPYLTLVSKSILTYSINKQNKFDMSATSTIVVRSYSVSDTMVTALSVGA